MPFPAGISCDIFLLRFVILVAAHHDSRFFAEYPGIGKPAECTFGSLEIYKAAQTHGTVCGEQRDVAHPVKGDLKAALLHYVNRVMSGVGTASHDAKK